MNAKMVTAQAGGMIPEQLNFNCAPDQPDSRDFQFQPSPGLVPPAALDLRACAYGFPPIYDQGQLNSCTANAVVAVLAYDIRRQNQDPNFEPSRLFVYYNERYAEHLIGQPSYGNHGAPAYMRDCIQTVDAQGFCSETDWPYDPIKLDTRPPDKVYKLALEHRACEYRRISQDVDQLKACLAGGDPFVCGIIVHQSFASTATQNTGIVAMPSEDEATLGGHAIAIVGYDDAKEWFIFRNSFGTAWGDQGHGYIPYNYLANAMLSMDFWMVKKVLDNLEGGGIGDGGSLAVSAATCKTAALGTTVGLADIPPALSQKVKLAGSPSNLTPPLWVEDAGCILFSDDKAVYAFSDDCQQLWSIASQYKLNGWAVNGSDIYVQDGCVICQYDINALDQNATIVPETAFNFKTHARWTSQTPGAGLESTIYTGCSGNDLLYSPPVIQFSDSKVPMLYVLNGAGVVIPMPADLNVDGSKVYVSKDKPDALNLFLSGPAGQQTLCYLSGEQVISLTTGDKITLQSKQAPAGGAALWTQLNQNANIQCQPWTRLAVAGFSLSAMVTRVDDPDSGSKLLIAMDNSQLSECTATLISQQNGQSFTSRARLTSGDAAGSPLPQLLTPPCVIIEMGTAFLFAISAIADTVWFQKFKMPAPNADASADNAWSMLQSQFAAVEDWFGSGGAFTPVPLDADLQILCLFSAVQAAGEQPSEVPASLTNACVNGSQNAIRLMVADGFNVFQAATTIKCICATSAQDMIRLLKSCGYGMQPVELVKLLKSCGYGMQPVELVKTFQDVGYASTEIAAAMKMAGYSLSDVYEGLRVNFFPCLDDMGIPPEVDQDALGFTDLMAALEAAGYTTSDIWVFLRGWC